MANHYEVVLTPGAEQDLEAIIGYIAEHDCPANAERVLDQFSEVLASLEHMPERGSIPKELLALGIREYRQLLFKPWRCIYRITESQRVVVYLVVDGRRDMQGLLQRRLLGSAS